MDWPKVATSDTPLPEGQWGLEARDGGVATYQTCTNPQCPSIQPDTEHAHLIRVQPAEQHSVR